MKKRIAASMLVFALCISLIQPLMCFAENPTLPDSKVIQSWKWEKVDSELRFNESEQQWELPVSPNVQEDELRDKFPTSVLATIVDNDTGGDISEEDNKDIPSQPNEDGENEDSQPQTAALELTWTVGDLSKLGDGENIIATATLPADYVLADGAAPLSITVLPYVEAVQMSAPLTCDWKKYEEYEEGAQDLSGTKINVFDYWTEADENGNVTEETRYNTDFLPYNKGTDEERYDWAFERFRRGINEGTPFKFSQQGYRNASPIEWEDYNIWTDGPNPHTGIVKRVLEGRYPTLAKLPGDFFDEISGKYWYDQEKDQRCCSLDYLFDPDIGHTGKAAYENANGLLQVDEDGYYYYDSTRNFAAFDGKNFRLYQKPAVPGNNTDATKSGQFFPFNTPDQVFRIENGQLTAKKPDGEEDPSNPMNRQSFINHYFGMTMTTRFAQKNGGKTYRGQETTYEFSGDDDVWVFIDDVLVADLGGIHDASKLSINFATGKVSVTGAADTTIRDQFKLAGHEGSEKDWKGNTFADDTYHTLRFFFMERGNNESNVKLKFNMVVIPESGIMKTDQFGNPIKDATFALYPAKVDADGNYAPTSKTSIWQGSTDEKGYLNLIDEETGGALTFEELSELGGSEYFILREESVPAGYRQNSDTYLHYDPDTDVTVSENEWQTGSHSQTMVTATLKNEIHKVNSEGEQEGKPLEPYENEEILKKGKIYAVVFRYMGDKAITSEDILEQTKESDWHPVVPDEKNEGWTVIEGGSSDEAIQQAIKKKPYGTELASDGSHKLKITGLPGDPNSYYHLWSKKLAAGQSAGQLLYTVNFYYVENDNYHRLDQEDFGRDFSVRLFIPNIKNYLVVHKVDGDDKSLNGAEFGLYEAKDVTVTENGYMINSGATPYDTVTTRELNQANGDPITGKGCAVFPSSGKKILEMGDYYLIETTAPAGYLGYPEAIHVIVDNSSVYVDAGTTNDGLTTSRYVGSLVHSMRQFAVDDKVDATLHDIKVQMQNTGHYEYVEGSAFTNNEDCDWSGWDDTASVENRKELHLNYKGKVNEFGSAYQSMTDEFRILGVEDEGWSQLYIRQCMDGKHSQLNSPKQDLGEQNLRNLFSTVMVAHVVNEPEGGSPDPGPDPSTVDVTVKKEWKLDDGGTRPDSVTVELLKDGEVDQTVTLNEANGWSYIWSGLSADYTWTVQEVNVPEGFTSTITQAGNVFVITNDDKPEEPGPEPSTVDVTVKKEWKLDDGGTRPDSVTVELLKDGEVDQTVTLNEANGWSYIWSGLSADYTWTVQEVNVPEGFTSTITQAGNVFVITNDDKPEEPGLDPSTVDLTVIKKWDDNGKKRPNSVEVTLYDGDTAVESVQLGKWNNWSHSWHDLDNHGRWKVIETNIPKGYVPSYSYQNGVVTITNTATLVQTGQLKWPIPVMGGLGLAFITYGFSVMLKKRKNEHD